MGGILTKLAEELAAKQAHQLKNTTVVVPTRRAGLFFKNQFIRLKQQPGWIPKITTLNEFVEELSGIAAGDQLVLAADIYQAYTKVLGAEANSFDHFLSWCPTLLKDFSDIDAYLLDPEKLFRDLRNYKELEEFSISQSEEHSAGQKREIQFWNEIGEIYRHFGTIQEHNKIGTAGFVSRRASAVAAEYVAEYSGYTYFVGFNALSASEQSIISEFESKQKGELWLDCDSYYTEDPLNEAGFFIRQIKAKGLGRCIENTAPIGSTPKTVRIGAANSASSQSEIAAMVLQKLSAEELQNTVLVLGDEALLIPVLNKIPKEINEVNITMGYRLRDSLVYDLISQYFELHRRTVMPNEERQFYYRQFLALVQHPLVTSLYTDARWPENVAAKVFSEKHIYLSPQRDLGQFLPTEPKAWKALELLLTSPENGSFQDLLDRLIQFFEAVLTASTSGTAMRTEELFQAIEAIRILQIKLKENAIAQQITEVKTMKTVLLRSISLAKVSFIGEPISGLQIMGLLETRALQFDRVIVLSANEGVLPQVSFSESFLPHEIKKFHGLPGRREREAIQAYHFYRLFQGCSSATFIYNSNTELDGSGEPSRYISQLRHELPLKNNKATVQDLQVPTGFSLVKSTQQLEKTPEILGQIRAHLKSGLSPSSINSYLACPLNWYYTRIADIPDKPVIEEEISEATRGTIVHHVLEELYKPFCGTNQHLSAADIDQFFTQYTALTNESFAREYNKFGYRFGANHIIYLSSVEMVKRFLDFEKVDLHKNGDLKIHDLEEMYRRQLSVELDGEVVPVLFKGLIDRIDERNGVIRVIDYKSGTVDPKQIQDPDKLHPDRLADSEIPSDKLLQLGLYIWLCQPHFAQKEIEAGIFALTAPTNRSIFINPAANPDWSANFEAFLKAIVIDLLNPKKPLTHQPEARYCNWC